MIISSKTYKRAPCCSLVLSCSELAGAVDGMLGEAQEVLKGVAEEEDQSNDSKEAADCPPSVGRGASVGVVESSQRMRDLRTDLGLLVIGQLAPVAAGSMLSPRLEGLVRVLARQAARASPERQKDATSTLLSLLAAEGGTHGSEGSEASEQDDGVDTRGIIMEVLISSFRKTSTAEIIDIRPLLPHLLSGLTRQGNTDIASGLMCLVMAMPETAVARVAVPIAGPLIRASMGSSSQKSAPPDRHAIFLALSCLVERAPVQMKVFVPQLQSTFFRGLSDSDDRVARQAATALERLLPLGPRAESLLAGFVGLLRLEASAEQTLRVLKCLRYSFAFLHKRGAWNTSTSSSLQARIDELRTALNGIHLQDEEGRGVLNACLKAV